MIRNCKKLPIPSAVEYFAEINPVSLCFTILAAILAACSVCLFAFQLKTVLTGICSHKIRIALVWLLALCPVTTVSSVIGICVPRSLPVIDLFITLYFSRAIFTFIHLVTELSRDVKSLSEELIKRNVVIKLNTVPMCCKCMPKLSPTVESIRLLEWMILQAPIIRVFVLLSVQVSLFDIPTANVMEGNLFGMVLNVLSALVALFACQVYKNSTKIVLEDYRLKSMVRYLQLGIFFYTIQNAIFLVLARNSAVFCFGSVSETMRTTVWYYIFLTVELFAMQINVTFSMGPTKNAMFDQPSGHERRREYDDYLVAAFNHESANQVDEIQKSSPNPDQAEEPIV